MGIINSEVWVRTLLIAFVALLSTPAHAGGWEGHRVKVKSSTLLCDFSSMKTALILQAAKDEESMQALINKGSCLKVPNDFFATVISDASTYTDPDLAQVMVKGVSIWGAMKDMNCCYKE